MALPSPRIVEVTFFLRMSVVSSSTYVDGITKPQDRRGDLLPPHVCRQLSLSAEPSSFCLTWFQLWQPPLLYGVDWCLVWLPAMTTGCSRQLVERQLRTHWSTCLIRRWTGRHPWPQRSRLSSWSWIQLYEPSSTPLHEETRWRLRCREACILLAIPGLPTARREGRGTVLRPSVAECRASSASSSPQARFPQLWLADRSTSRGRSGRGEGHRRSTSCGTEWPKSHSELPQRLARASRSRCDSTGTRISSSQLSVFLSRSNWPHLSVSWGFLRRCLCPSPFWPTPSQSSQDPWTFFFPYGWYTHVFQWVHQVHMAAECSRHWGPQHHRLQGWKCTWHRTSPAILPTWSWLPPFPSNHWSRCGWCRSYPCEAPATGLGRHRSTCYRQVNTPPVLGAYNIVNDKTCQHFNNKAHTEERVETSGLPGAIIAHRKLQRPITLPVDATVDTPYTIMGLCQGIHCRPEHLLLNGVWDAAERLMMNSTLDVHQCRQPNKACLVDATFPRCKNGGGLSCRVAELGCHM